MPPGFRPRARPPGRHLTDDHRPAARRAALSPLALGCFLMVAGALHFVIPRSYQRIVPRLLGHAPLLVSASGVAEMVAGALVAVPRTRRPGAVVAFVLLLLVWPANVQMALDAGIPGAGLPTGSAVVAWVRVPLQIPLLVWAWRVAHRAGPVQR